MFVFLSKLLPLFFYPVSLACILLLLALRARSARVRRTLVGGAFGLLFLLGNGWVSGLLVRSLEWQHLPLAAYPVADAIVVLGGGTEPADFPRPGVEVNSAGDRVIHGARLYREGRAPLVIVTGGNLPWAGAASTAAGDMQELLVFFGVPAEAILVEGESDNTYENAVLTRAMAAPLGVERILLVTSALHMPRSVPLFENQGFEVIPAPADFQTTRAGGAPDGPLPWQDILFGVFPSPYALSQTTAALKEYLGIAVYWLRGWW